MYLINKYKLNYLIYQIFKLIKIKLFNESRMCDVMIR